MQPPSIKNLDLLLENLIYPFNAWCPQKVHTYLNKSVAFSYRLKYVCPFSEHQALNG